MGRNVPDETLPDDLTWQPEKQAARKKDIETEIADLERMRDKFLRIMLRYEYSTDLDLRLQVAYDFYQWVVKRADLNGYRGLEYMAFVNDEEKVTWEIREEEIEKRFDKILAKSS